MTARCPFCFDTFAPRAAPFRCAEVSSRCEWAPDPVLNEKWRDSSPQPRLIVAPWTWGIPRNVACPACGFRSPRRVCPHCHLDLPSYIGEGDSSFIAILGARDAGKSHLIAVLIEELQKTGAALNLSVSASEVDRSSHRYERDFRRPLAGKRTIDSTQTGLHVSAAVRTPLLFSLTHRRPGDAQIRGRLDLVFFDAAGEDLGQRASMVRANRYLQAAAFLLVVVDPTRFRGVQQGERARREWEAEDEPATPLDDICPDGSDVLRRTADLLRSAHSLPPGRVVPVPAAIVLSKWDRVLPQVRENPWSSLVHPARHQGGFDDVSTAARSQELRTQVAEWGAPGLVSAADECFQRTRFFAVSALGASPHLSRLPHAPLPLGVEDPVLWFLHLRGMIGAAP